MRLNGSIVALGSKSFEYIQLCGIDKLVADMVDRINRHFKLGTLVHGPGSLRYFDINLHQRHDKLFTIDCDEKLYGIKGEPVKLFRHRELDSPLMQ